MENALRYGFSLYGMPKTGSVDNFYEFSDGQNMFGKPDSGPLFTEVVTGWWRHNGSGVIYHAPDNGHYSCVTDAIDAWAILGPDGEYSLRIANYIEAASLAFLIKLGVSGLPAGFVFGDNACFTNTQHPDDNWANPFVIELSPFAIKRLVDTSETEFACLPVWHPMGPII